MAMYRIFLAACLVLAMAEAPQAAQPQFTAEDELNFYCLRQAYPEIKSLTTEPDGSRWLILEDGRKLEYASIRQAMAQPYPLEPERPATPAGVAPGRERPYALFNALYGDNAASVRKQLVQTQFNGKQVTVAARLKEPLANVASALARISNPALKRFLGPDGGFVWRKIAGEDRLSAHSYGIALDIGARHSPYWRWSKVTPHPMQATYPQKIVEEFEKQGFIWGGKWHEYDLMHFEYRPELICKAKKMRGSPANR